MRNTDEAPRAIVVNEARTWVGTPYRHQAKVKGAGVDCVGLCLGVGLALDLLPTFDREAWREFAGYGRLPNPTKMEAGLRRFLVPVVGAAQPGDWAWMQWATREGRDLPMHMAMLAYGPSGPSIIHAFADVGACVEHGFTAEWPARVVSWWRYPGLVAPDNAATLRKASQRGVRRARRAR